MVDDVEVVTAVTATGPGAEGTGEDALEEEAGLSPPPGVAVPAVLALTRASWYCFMSSSTRRSSSSALGYSQK